METKQHIREKMLAVRKELSPMLRKEKSKNIAGKLFLDERFQRAGYILLYADYKEEVETEEIFHEARRLSKKVYYPKVEGNHMAFFEVGSLKELQSGYRGILEPEEKDPYPQGVEGESFMILPGVAFDKDGTRIGYGKGYYDRFLQEYSLIYKAGVCFVEQVAKRIPAEAHDKRMDALYTDERVYKIEKR